MVIAGLIAATLSASSPPVSVIRVSEAVPRFDIERSCRDVGKLDTGIGRTNQACSADESKARGDLEQRWMTFPAASRSTCQQAADLGGPPSYVELLTCLEMAAAPK